MAIDMKKCHLCMVGPLGRTDTSKRVFSLHYKGDLADFLVAADVAELFKGYFIYVGDYILLSADTYTTTVKTSVLCLISGTDGTSITLSTPALSALA